MKRLGLDIGTNSIGWCLTEDDSRIVDIGARIFSDGRDPKSGASLAVDRRAARAMRRRRDRYIGRRNAFLIALKRHGLLPADEKEAKLIADKDPYDLRARALTEKLDLFEIGRALFHLNQRRGFKSNRKAERKTKDAEDGKIASASYALDREIDEGGFDTLGQFLRARLLNGDGARVRMNSASQAYDFYPDRRHVDYEFQRIWDEQAKHHPSLMTQSSLTWKMLRNETANTESAHSFDQARDAIYRILFFQRRLKEQKVGRCTFIDEPRLAKAHPLFQERRLYEELNQLEITTPGAANEKLTLDQREALILKLRKVKAASFDSLGKIIKLQPGQSFNKASAQRTQLAGDEVYAALSDKKRFGPAWAHLSVERQWEIIERLLDEEDPEKLHAFLTQDCGLDEDTARITARVSLPEGHGRLGATATRLILDEHKAAVITYSDAVQKVAEKDQRFRHHSDFRTGECLDRLPYYGELLSREIPPGTQDPAHPEEVRWGKITNPTVHIGLRQLEKLVNAIIAVHGRPDQIVVELARELKLNEKQKEEHNRRIRQDTAAAQQRSKDLGELGQQDTGANRALLRIWKELSPNSFLDRACPYCGETISPTMLFDARAQVDHIIPYSKSLDDSISNKVVVHRHCNQQKGNQTPWDAWGDGRDPERWEKIAIQVARLPKPKQWRFGPEGAEKAKDRDGFIARQLTDTQYLSRLAGKYLSSLYPSAGNGHVFVVTGRMTAMLRRLWALNDILDDSKFVDNRNSNAPKNRLDHRHHAIDAFVLAATSQGLMAEIAKAAGRAEERNLDKMFEGLPEPWPGYLPELRERLQRTVVSHKADHGRKGVPPKGKDSTAGRLHNDTAYGFTGDIAADGKTPIVVHRVPLASLKPADLENDERIPDPALRAELQRQTQGLAGKEFTSALERFSKDGSLAKDKNGKPVFEGVRHLRVREPLNVIPVKDKSGREYKAYKGDANALFELWRLPNGKLKSRVVSMFAAHQPAIDDDRPHPAAKRLLQLRQNDQLAIERRGNPAQIVRVVGFNVAGRLTLAAANEAGNLKERDSSSDETDPFKYIYLSGGSILKAKARQVRIDPLGRVSDPGPRD